MSGPGPASASTWQKSGSTAGPTMRAPGGGGGGLANASTTSAASRSTAPGTTLFGLMASKRLARQFANRVIAKRHAGSESTTLQHHQPAVEPTYRMEPLVRFQVGRVEDSMRNLVDMRMRAFKYTPKVAAMVSKVLTSEIKDAVKQMAFDRYKIVCVVTIGQKQLQDMRISSRCSWDTSVDTSASYTWSDANAFCCATVYGMYHE